MTASTRSPLLLLAIVALLVTGVAGALVHEGTGRSDRSVPAGEAAAGGTSTSSTPVAPATSTPDSTGSAGPAPATTETSDLARGSTESPGSGLATGGNGRLASDGRSLASTGAPPWSLPGGLAALALGAALRNLVRRSRPLVA